MVSKMHSGTTVDAQEAERQAGDVHLRGLPLQRVREVFHYREAGGHLRGVPQAGRQVMPI